MIRCEGLSWADMTNSVTHTASPSLEVTLAGISFRTPIALAPIGGGSHFGRRDPDPKREFDITLRFLLDQVRAGSSCLYLNFSYLTEATYAKVLAGRDPNVKRERTGWAERFLKAATPGPPYGLEGLYSAVSPGPSVPSLEAEEALVAAQARLIEALKQELPEKVRIVGGIIGCGGIPEAYVDAARKCQELGVDLVELNFHCPLQAGMRDAVDNVLYGRFPPYSQGGLMIEHADLVERIAREVVGAVTLPVGAKFSAEVGFPRIVGLARRLQRAGAKYVSVGGAAVGIAPPDIYNRGKPLWRYVDGNPFCLTSGSWMRRVCYRDVAAVARFVPDLDVVASGGLVTPEHCVEAMMLGATMTQMCAGVMEQGRSLLRRSNRFLQDFLVDQGYGSAREIIGLGQQYIAYPEDVDMMAGHVVVEVDQEKCTRCGRCLNNLCVAIQSDRRLVTVDRDKCTGCGACALACREGALRLVLKP